MGGSNEDINLVKLSVEDHINAHILLSECFDENTYERISNLRSARFIAKNSIGKFLYDNIKISAHAKAKKDSMEYSFCDIYVGQSEGYFNEFKEFHSELKNKVGTQKFHFISEKLEELYNSKNLTGAKKFIRLFLNEYSEVTYLKSILIISKGFKPFDFFLKFSLQKQKNEKNADALNKGTNPNPQSSIAQSIFLSNNSTPPPPPTIYTPISEEELADKKKTSTKMEFKSEFVGKTTQIKFEDSPVPLNSQQNFKKTNTFYHESEEIVTGENNNNNNNAKKFAKAYESNL